VRKNPDRKGARQFAFKEDPDPAPARTPGDQSLSERILALTQGKAPGDKSLLKIAPASSLEQSGPTRSPGHEHNRKEFN
jgi:hypothetical protein